MLHEFRLCLGTDLFFQAEAGQLTETSYTAYDDNQIKMSLILLISRDSVILNHDVRIKEHVIDQLRYHQQEVLISCFVKIFCFF